ncbi:Laminin subunit alpha-1 [Frankliniella fusca]|uniref:Laminin subunit alpha-1 n=1 Tax=Frankliniella fusca TaxID=407009 RepID=A0AAE1HIF7_9NEOP|nr:Laminin subunit alpha-1 [Frankliniella fusca]
MLVTDTRSLLPPLFLSVSSRAGCGCHASGALHAACDIVTGRCECKTNVVGRACDACKHGFWGLDSGLGCQACACDPLGAHNSSCDPVTGQCACRPGIGGRTCDSCLPGYVGFSPDGCRECDPCDKPGHVCDPDTGHCVCPPLTFGDECEVCEMNSWGFRSGKGCKPCACDPAGSYASQCDAGTGQCSCRRGYAGSRCDTCAHGFYGFPSCRSCRCDARGADPASCDASGLCGCGPGGQCRCKSNAAGPRCDACRPGTFGLRADDADGCQACFCFGRSSLCSEEGLTWGRLTQFRPRTLDVHYESTNPQFRPGAQLFPVNTKEICYINLALPGVPGASAKTTNSTPDRLDVINNLRIIPGDAGDVEMGVNYLFDTPVYWQLPRQFLGDRVLSFGGFLRFSVEAEGGSTLFPPEVLGSYPLVQLQGNNRIVLEHFPAAPSRDGHYEIRLHHSLWRAKNNATSMVSRELLMLALQNVQHVLIRATDSIDFTKAVLRGISLDTAQALEGGRGPPARGVELCECPRQYSASSCQDPSIGFFRWHDRSAVHSTIVIQMVGEARPCECSGRSTVCDVETGHCKNCSSNTGGPACDRCAEGFYGDPDGPGGCRACPCPSEQRNFATSCKVVGGEGAGADSEAVCHCREGYEGARCDRCAPGWFAPAGAGGACQPCLCDPLGSVGEHCDPRGRCECLPGVSGPRCSVCPLRQVLTARGTCTTCEDACTGELLRGLEDLAFDLDVGAKRAADGILEAPWAVLDGIHGQAKHARERLLAWEALAAQARQVLGTAVATLRKPANQAVKEAKKEEHASAERAGSSLRLRQGAEDASAQIERAKKQIQDTVTSLRAYSAGPAPHVSSGSALADAQYVLDTIAAGMTYLEPRATHTYNNFKRCDEIYDDLVKLLDFEDVRRVEGLRRRVLRLQEGLRDLNETLGSSSGNASHVSVVSCCVASPNERFAQAEHSSSRQVDLRFTNKNRRKLKELVARVAWLSGEEASLSSMVTANADTLNAADAALSAAEANLSGVRRHQARLSDLTASLAQRVRAESRPDLAHYYVIARDRANMLRHTADMYERLFSGTKSDAQLALQASAAYRNIADAFRDALHGALNASLAAEQAYRQAYPKHLDSLLDQSDLALQDSRRLQGSAREQARRVSRLRQHLAEHEGVVDKLRETIILAGRRNNDNHRPLQQLQQLEGQLGAERGVAQRVLDDMLDEQRAALHMKLQAGEVLANVSSVLRPLLSRVAGGGEGEQDGQGAGLGFGATERQVKELRETIVRVNDTLQRVEGESAEQQREFQRWNDSVADKLQALRDKITRARHAAEGIRLSLKTSKQAGAAAGAGCSRSYALPQAGPSTTTTITLYYAATGKARSAPIFYLPSSSTEDFIALDMVERRVRLSWDVGGGPGSVTAPQALRAPRELPPGVGQTEGRDEEVWYRVVAERTGNIGHLSVSEDARPEGAAPPKVVFNASAAGFGRLDPGSVAWVGGDGVGSGARVGLAGCVHSLELDGRPIGLWNFRTSSGNCGACKQGVSQEHDDQSYNFRGDGYSELRQTSTSPYNKYFFSVSLNFRSFDENALLFLAVADNRRSYVSLSLHEGKVRYRIGYGSQGDSFLEITTAAKYNTGNWTRVEASRYFDRNRRLEKGLLKVDSESRNGSPSTPIKADALPDMSGALYYIGGVPPGFTTVGPFEKPVPFLGCMSMIQVAQEGYNPMRGQFYGVEASCADKPLRVASFGGDGYLELPSHALRKKSSFGFAFATLQPDTMLMLSTFQRPGGTTSAEVAEENTNFIELEDNNSYYSCALWNGRLEVRVDAGRGTAVLQSGGDGAAAALNDGHLHAVAVTKTGRRLELRVDDVVQSSATLPEGAAAVKAPGDVGGLFFGGVPSSLNVSDLLATTMPLIGTIKDAIFNDELLSMDHPVSFQHAAIGRLSPVGPVPDATRAVGTSPVLPSPQPPSSVSSSPSSAPSSPHSPPPPHEHDSGGCRRLSGYSFEQDASKFGDRPNSHVLVTFRRRNLLQRDFLVELQFRTFYPSGMLYLVPGAGAGASGGGGGKQRQYLAAYLLDGIFQVVYKGRNKLEVSLPNTYNDGSWHTVRLKKEGRILTLSVDNDNPERRKGPKKMNIGHNMYIGGLPDNNLLVPDNFVQRLQHFRGCLRGLTVNNMSQDLVGDNAIHHQVGQCYANVEQGSFFAGDAYAIYKNKFVVDDLLQIELEFRTSELNAIILSISELKGYPAVSLELNSGQVILAGDIGDRRRFEITVRLPSMWTLCDNRWHRIQISYKNGELVLQVDDMKQSQPLADNGHYVETRINSPVYIGGLPEGAHSETLGVKDNFKGCIRKVMIGGERRDWTIMADLHNIELGSCPLVN